MAKLRILSGPQAPGEPFEIGPSCITIGRAKGNQCRLEHRSVSKYHALIISDEDGDLLFDLDSTNGTFLNNQRVSSAPLKQGDHLRLGEFVLAYETTSQPAVAAKPVLKPVANQPLVAPRPLTRLRTESAAAAAYAPPTKPAMPAAPTPAVKPPPSTLQPAAAETPSAPAPAQKKVTSAQEKAFIRLPGEKPSPQSTSGKTGFVQRVLGRDEPVASPPNTVAPPPRPATAAPAASPPPAPAPAAAAPAAGGAEESVDGAAEPHGDATSATAGQLLKKPAGEQPRDQVLLRPPARQGGDIVLKKPGPSPKEDKS